MTQIPNDDRALTIYKASAGSGKTFTLSAEYIKLLIRQPYSHRTILAVTFTNKATEEMKLRILSQLYGIWKHLPDSKNYLEKIARELSASEEFVAKRSGIALRNIIHDYSYFRIETIDTFFQSILRNLARELDLTANLRVELNDYQVEHVAVDELIEELDSRDTVLQWILSYIKENIDDDKNWNVIGQIKKFGENIFRDYYKSHSDRLNKILEEPDFFKDFTGKMRRIMRQTVDEIKEIAISFTNELDVHGLEIDDFAYGKLGVCGYFIKLGNGEFDGSILTKRVIDAMDDPEKWVKKSGIDKQKHAVALDLVHNKLWNMLNETEKKRSHAWKMYKSADLTLRHMNQIRLLNYIEKKVRTLNADANRFLLSDTQTLLHALIKNTDTPFIFEKIGTQLEHVMIDEFQDTGTVQWKNFKVLLDECMSHGQNGNLIVGDVKQSIYRWRSGDWRLLNDITSQYTDSIDRICLKTLNTNYRSLRNITEFNNAFFKTAARLEQSNILDETNSNMHAEQLRRAYSDVEQQVPASKHDNGLVRIELLPHEDYQETSLHHLLDTIEHLIQAGIHQDKIAILVRSNATIQLIADFFTKEAPHINIVSDEAFKLENSITVNIMVNALRLLVHPEDKLAMAFLAKSYHKHVLHKSSLTDNEILTCHDNVDKNLPKEFMDSRNHLITMPLYDIVERLYAIFQLDTMQEENAYISTFYDNLNTFIADNTADIDTFLDEWDSNIHKKTIQASEIDGVRLITIHKSKGLEFDNVLVPFCDWKMDNATTIWCTPEEEPFSALPIVPVDYSAKQMKGTIYEKDYKDEYLQNTVDNLNLLYVAFTRASSNLFVFGRIDNRNTRSKIIELCLPEVVNMLPGATLQGGRESSCEAMTFCHGNLFVSTNDKANISHNIFLQPVTKKNTSITTFKQIVDFRQSNQSREFTNDNEANKQDEYIKQGAILHQLFSTIRTIDDIEMAIQELDFKGVIYDCGMTVEQLRKFLNERLRTPLAIEWFSPKWQLFNECAILSYDANLHEVVGHRPDRVMTDGNRMIIVDFKFGRPKPEYRQQVKNYMTLVSDMGYQNVTGYLWFVYSNVIEEVK